MTEATESEPQELALIAQYKRAAAKQRIANRAVTLICILIVLGSVYAIWTQITNFRDHGIERFNARLEQEAAKFMPTVSADASEMMNRLVPVYINSFETVVERDEGAYRQLLSDEFSTLNLYAQEEAWPMIEQALAQLVADQETVLSTELADLLEREQVLEISVAYRFALQSYLKDFYATQFAEHDAIGNEIVSKIRRIAESNEAPSATNSSYVVGLLVELLGLEIQDISVRNGPLF